MVLLTLANLPLRKVRILTRVDDPSGRKIKIVVDDTGKPVKADTIRFVNFGDFAWSKTDHGVVANANTLIQLYRDMGYQY